MNISLLRSLLFSLCFFILISTVSENLCNFNQAQHVCMRVIGRERECVYARTSCCSCALVAVQTSQGHYKTRTDSERNMQLASGATARGESVLYRLVEFFRPQLRTFPHHPCTTRSDLLLRCKEPGHAVCCTVSGIDRSRQSMAVKVWTELLQHSA